MSDFFDKLGEFLSNVRTNTPSNPDSKTTKEIRDYEKAFKDYELDYKHSYLKTRKWIGRCTFWLVWLWLAAVIYIVISLGAGRLLWTCVDFKLEKEITITLITTTSVSVLAFLMVVMRNLFPKGPDDITKTNR